MKLKDSGSRREFETGAVRDMAEGKGRMDLLPFGALIEVSKLYEKGCEKYGERNYALGIPLHVYADSALRHIAKLMDNWQDEPHLIQAAWNILNLIDTLLKIEKGELPKSLAEKMPIDQIILMDKTIKIKE